MRSWLPGARRPALFVSTLVVGFVGLAVLRRSLLVVEVVGSSMEPTYADGARLLAVRGAEPRRGQVVVLRHQQAAGRPVGATSYLVKRVVALPGDTVGESVRAAAGADLVPPGQCIVLGDNAESVDSRSWGFVPRGDIVGRVVRALR